MTLLMQVKSEICEGCTIVQTVLNDKSPGFIHEFESSVLILGSHQYFKGYSVLFLKKHVRDMIDLELEAQQKIFQELMKASKAIQKAFNPWKLNYSCYGNKVQHIHWHIFPRYEGDPSLLETPWKNVAKFNEFIPSQDTMIKTIRLIQNCF